MVGRLTCGQFSPTAPGHLTRTVTGAEYAPYPFALRACTFTTYIRPLGNFLVRHLSMRGLAVQDVRYFSDFPELR